MARRVGLGRPSATVAANAWLHQAGVLRTDAKADGRGQSAAGRLAASWQSIEIEELIARLLPIPPTRSA
jgi:hypothetical protein